MPVEGESESTETNTESESTNTESESKSETKEETPKTFTQSELETILQKRLAKYKDFETVAAKAKQYDELANKDKSESQKLQEELDKLKEQDQERLNKYQTVLRRSAIISEANKLNLIDPETAFELLMAKGFPGIEIDEDADSVSGVGDALVSLVKEKPFLKAGKFNPVRNGPQGSGEDDLAEMSTEEFMRRMTPKDSRLSRALDIG